jgi:hypothetical protein
MIVWGGDTFYPVTPGGRYCVDICGSSVTCTDGNTCTTDTCDPTSGCVYTSSPGPPEIQSIAVAADKATFSWPAAQDTTQYDVVRGSTGAFPVGPSGDDEVCFDNLVGATVTDPTVPNAGEGFWYLSRGENSCGIGTFGTQSDGTPRMTTTCP